MTNHHVNSFTPVWFEETDEINPHSCIEVVVKYLDSDVLHVGYRNGDCCAKWEVAITGTETDRLTETLPSHAPRPHIPQRNWRRKRRLHHLPLSPADEIIIIPL
jgi:hypothetical protein